MEGPKHPLHLKYPDLQKTSEVAKAVEKKERLNSDEKRIPNDPRVRLETYMNRLENVFLNPDERVRERNTEMLREKVYDAFTIKRENVPESFFELQKRIARERGQQVEEIPPQMRERMIDTIVEDQRASLDRWMHYLQSNDAMYPSWFKYFVFRNVVNLSQFDKTLGKFKTRTESTTAPFPDIYHEPLAQICDIYEAVDKNGLKDPTVRQSFEKKFPSLYAELIQKSLAEQMETKEEVKGEWTKFVHGNMSDAEKLFESLQGKGTGWCTAGRSTAEKQIESGDFYVFYTYDKDERASQPRVAIRMEGDHIAEVRGILENQQMEPQMQEALDEKLKEFGSEADTFKRKSADMKLLTEIEQKTAVGTSLTKDETVFLYELNTPIEGFGYARDPRIQEIRAKRDITQDAAVIFDCTVEQIARSEVDLSKPDIKIYIGQLSANIFSKLPSGFEHVYVSFPEGRIGLDKIHLESFEIGGKNTDQLEREMQERKIRILNGARRILNDADFETSANPKNATIVRFKVRDIGFQQGATNAEIYQRAKELGLEFCPAEVGPNYRLAYTDQSVFDKLYIGMNPISQYVFLLDREGSLRLNGRYKADHDHASPDTEFAFLLLEMSQ